MEKLMKEAYQAIDAKDIVALETVLEMMSKEERRAFAAQASKDWVSLPRCVVYDYQAQEWLI